MARHHCVLCQQRVLVREICYAGWPTQFEFCETCYIRNIGPLLDWDEEDEEEDCENVENPQEAHP